MSTVKFQGVLDIELVDVYAWLERQCGGIPEHDTAMFFSAEDDKLVLPLGKGKKAIEVPGEDFWQWVTSEQLPLPLRSVEVAYGVPMVVGADEHCLRVNFAASSSDDPRSWADKPACLAEWKHKNLTPIRVEWEGVVLRLFPSEHAARSRAALLARPDCEAYSPRLHPSECGWLLVGQRSGAVLDDDGPVEAPGAWGSGESRLAAAGGVGEGWQLLAEREALRPGDGFLHPAYSHGWIDFECRPDAFRGDGQHVHGGWLWRRRLPAS